MKGSITVVALFAAGLLLGTAHPLPAIIADGRMSHGILCALMCCIGFGIGHDAGIARRFRSIPPLLMLLPPATIAGTLAGSAAASALLPHRSLGDCLAVASGMGYYSLSSILIGEARGAALATVALLSNIIREIFTLLCAPLLARRLGPLAPISSGGATTMDTTLPIIVRAAGSEYALLSIYHGFCTDLAVPFLVTFFLTGR